MAKNDIKLGLDELVFRWTVDDLDMFMQRMLDKYSVEYIAGNIAAWKFSNKRTLNYAKVLRKLTTSGFTKAKPHQLAFLQHGKEFVMEKLGMDWEQFTELVATSGENILSVILFESKQCTDKPTIIRGIDKYILQQMG